MGGIDRDRSIAIVRIGHGIPQIVRHRDIRGRQDRAGIDIGLARQQVNRDSRITFGDLARINRRYLGCVVRARHRHRHIIHSRGTMRIGGGDLNSHIARVALGQILEITARIKG